MGAPESFYAIRRTDGEDIGDYSWVSASGPADWTAAEDDAEEAEEHIEYELCQMTVEVVQRRTFGPTSPCDEWEGEETYPAASWVSVFLRTDGTEQTYPARDVDLQHFPTQDEADAFIASLPDTIHILPTYGHLTEISRDRLTTEAQGYPARPGRCEKCGRPKRAHEAAS